MKKIVNLSTHNSACDFHRGVDLCEIIGTFPLCLVLPSKMNYDAWTWFEYVWFESLWSALCLLKKCKLERHRFFGTLKCKNRSKCKLDLWVFKAWPMLWVHLCFMSRKKNIKCNSKKGHLISVLFFTTFEKPDKFRFGASIGQKISSSIGHG